MRELKFRAWDKKTKKMREVESIGFGAISYMKDGYPVCNMIGRDCITNEDMIIHRDSPDFILQQFTGLTDSKGVEIYEGDIVKCYHFTDDSGHHFIKHIIKWSEKFNGWFAMNAKSKSDDDGSIQLWVYMKSNKHTTEVIGNIHQNQELLENSND